MVVVGFEVAVGFADADAKGVAVAVFEEALEGVSIGVEVGEAGAE